MWGVKGRLLDCLTLWLTEWLFFRLSVCLYVTSFLCLSVSLFVCTMLICYYLYSSLFVSLILYLWHCLTVLILFLAVFRLTEYRPSEWLFVWLFKRVTALVQLSQYLYAWMFFWRSGWSRERVFAWLFSDCLFN